MIIGTILFQGICNMLLALSVLRSGHQVTSTKTQQQASLPHSRIFFIYIAKIKNIQTTIAVVIKSLLASQLCSRS